MKPSKEQLELPRGREAVRNALIEAAARLFAERGPSQVSVREVAAEARVNHGLVHRHFGSKEGLLRAVLNDMAARVADRVGPAQDDEDLRTLLAKIFSDTRGVGLHWKVLARALLEGWDPSELQQRFPVFARLVAATRRSPDVDVDPVSLAVLLFSTGLGLLVFEPYLEAAAASEGSSWPETLQGVIGTIAESLRRAPAD